MTRMQNSAIASSGREKFGIGETRSLLPEEMQRFLLRSLIRTAGAALVLGAGFIAIALFSHSADDPSWNNTVTASAKNLAGVSGAYLSDLLVQWLGVLGMVPAACLAVWGVRLIFELRLPLWRERLLALLFGLPVAGLSLSAFHTLELWGIWPLKADPGGALGSALMNYSLYHLEKIPFALSWFTSGPHIILGLVGAVFGAPALLFALAITPGQWRGAGDYSARAFTFSARFARRPVMWLRAQAGKRRKPLPRAVARRELDLDRAPPLRRSPRGEASSGQASPQSRQPAGNTVSRVARETGRSEAKSRRAALADQAALDLGRVGEYQLPPLSLLRAPPAGKGRGGNQADLAESDEALEQNARMLETVLQDFGVRGEILNVRPGPVVTLYELEPAPGIKSSRVIGLADDIARSMSAVSARVAVIPGRNAIGIELPNSRREMVYLRELLSSGAYENTAARLTLSLGKTIGGEPVIADLAAMPHLLIAGTTGSGKSVGINTMILSLLYRLPPDQCKFIMIDPKMLELSVYDGIPHLLAPVVTEPAKAVVALKWTVREMEDRYRKMSRLGVRSIAAYNQRVAAAAEKGEILKRTVQTGFDPGTGRPIFEEQEMNLEPLPFIVVIVDEMADLMMVAGKDIEVAVQRLAQMARAAGIHLIMATQRPSVDVITGTIKANFPTRISFQVTSKIDSRTILGEQGAEQLLGQGDMLYMAGGGRITRVHGPYVSDEEVEKAVAFLKTQGAPAYLEAVTEEADAEITADMMGMAGDGEAALYDKAVAMVASQGRVSTSLIQRHLRIGYNRAARIVEEMEEQGVIGPPNHSGKREVLIGER